MSQSRNKMVERLSKELARIAGLRLRPAVPGDQAHSLAGQLKGLLPSDFFEWNKCPVHGTWLQPALKPYPHWECLGSVPVMKEGHSQPEGWAHCQFKRPAKFRSRIERRIFAVRRFIEEHAND